MNHQLLTTVNWPLITNFIVRKYLRLYICRDTITDVVSALQINLFLQNEPNFRKVKLNVNKVLTREYVQLDTWSIRTKQSQTNPNKPKTNPILANKTTIRIQFKPNLSCRSPLTKQEQTQFYYPFCLRSRILPLRLLNTTINRTCCICRSSVSFDSAKMALYKANWNYNKYGRKKLKLLNYKKLNKLSRRRVLTGTLFAHLYMRIFVLNKW